MDDSELELPSSSIVKMSLPVIGVKGQKRRKNPEKRNCWSHRQGMSEVAFSFFHLPYFVKTMKISLCFPLSAVHITYTSSRHQVCVRPNG